MIKKIKDWYKIWKRKREIKKRLKELQEKDPFTYDQLGCERRVS